MIQLGIGLRDTLTVLVCGGREYQNYEVVKAALDDLESEHGERDPEDVPPVAGRRLTASGHGTSRPLPRA